ncbi:NAD(P)-binding protein [Aulographum hederae CBS 113979]|uniref:NAD(P)-binding protein n=1 Tax=Aulographum hederae CBS 113979 TaxID=1176131 RepID=A0A6G1HD74_9PEZI|nr:NAD(P)-binding protein [Aulographum hederae CBS 113979]
MPTPSSEPPVWFITAASSGFGAAIARAALSRGHHVIATARSAAKISDLKELGAVTISLDVTWPMEKIEEVAKEAYAVWERFDIVVNAAGYMVQGAVEEVSHEETMAIFSTNVFGALNVTRALLPYMRPRRTGVIATFGSLGSWRGFPGGALYCATKWSASAIAESLRLEVAPLGIQATVIEPGYFRSGFLNPGALIQSQKRIQDYEESAVGEFRKVVTTVDNNQPGDVGKGAEVIVDVLSGTGVGEGRKVPVRLVLGSDAQKVIRGKCEETVKLLDEWKSVSDSTDY